MQHHHTSLNTNPNSILTLVLDTLKESYDIHPVDNTVVGEYLINPKDKRPPFRIVINDLKDMVNLIYNQKFIWAENAIKNCLFEFAMQFNDDLTDEELEIFKGYSDDAPSEEAFNQWYDTFFPMLEKRIERRNTLIDGEIRTLKLTQFGHELRTDGTSIEIDWCFDADGGIDITQFNDHKAMINEFGQIFITSLTDKDGKSVDLSQFYDATAEGIPLTPKPLDWLNIKARMGQLYLSLNRAKA